MIKITDRQKKTLNHDLKLLHIKTGLCVKPLSSAKQETLNAHRNKNIKTRVMKFFGMQTKSNRNINKIVNDARKTFERKIS